MDRSARPLSDSDLQHTVHFVVARTLARLIGFSDTPSELKGGSALGSYIVSQDPSQRRLYAHNVSVGWGALAGLFTVLLVVIGFSARALFGDEAGRLFVGLCLAATFFCLAGTANALWRMTWFFAQARRRQADGGPAFAKSLRRIIPGNTSLLLQVAVGIVAFALAR